MIGVGTRAALLSFLCRLGLEAAPAHGCEMHRLQILSAENAPQRYTPSAQRPQRHQFNNQCMEGLPAPDMNIDHVFKQVLFAPTPG